MTDKTIEDKQRLADAKKLADGLNGLIKRAITADHQQLREKIKRLRTKEIETGYVIDDVLQLLEENEP